MNPPPLRTEWLGRVDYARALALQEERVESRLRGLVPDTLLLLEHSPVITLGPRTRPEHLKVSEEEALRRGIEIVPTGRGGGATYHGPGQLVVYPVVDLRPECDLHRYLRRLEETLIEVARDYGVEAHRREGLTGVWVGTRKLASIGIRVRRWVAYHGVCLNVGGDLAGFDLIVACGNPHAGVTTLTRLTGRSLAAEEVGRRFCRRFARVFGRVLLEESGGMAHEGGSR